MVLFTLATLIPAALICGAALWGGLWVWAALAFITVLCAAMDRLVQGDAARREPGAEFPAGDALSVTLAVLHLPMLGLVIWAVGGHGPLSGTDRVGLILGAALFFGQITHPNAHELIHRPARTLRALGVMSYATLLMGHHASAHRLVHHVHVATDQDPNSAPKGVGFWRFAPRAWIGSFRAGLAAERALRAKNNRKTQKLNPYIIYLLWAITAFTLSFTLANMTGILTLLIIAIYAQIQVLLADYVQHYGLRRARLDSGKYAPVSAAHSWNSPHVFSSAMMLNAPRHSDHHMYPARHYPALELTPAMPVLPHSLPVMAVIALVPPLWRRVMDPRLQALAKT